MNAARKKAKRKSAAAKDIVYGIGSTGLSIARYLQRSDVDACYIDSREAPPGLDELKQIDSSADIILGETPKKLLQSANRMIVSPGVADSDPTLCAARDAGIEVISDIELFVREAQAPIVAVTGSNGKSTVTTVLSLMCNAAGKSALAGANLGEPALDLLEHEQPDLYVLELSSFQLQRTSELPVLVAVLLNISPDHLDWHESEDEYRAAKYRIFREAENAVINRADKSVTDEIDEGVRRLSFGLDEPQDGNYGIRHEDGEDFLACGEQLLLSTADIAMVGAHNQANALAALAAGDIIGLDLSPMLQVLNEFPGLPHRMQHLGRLAGVSYINDSKATNVGAAIASVASINGLVVLIAGGQGKGGDFAALADAVHRKLRAAVLIGEDADSIAASLEGLAPVHRAKDMREAVRRCAEISESGDTVLLAPACASFDQYDNYGARGDDFCRHVGELGSQ